MSGRLNGYAARSAGALHPAVRARLVRTLPGRRSGGPDHGLLSVVIPARDVAPYLQECLAGIVTQSYRNLEVLVVDDGSIDGTGTVARRFARRDRRIRVITQAPAGPGAARNTGIAAARGRFLAFADADDVVAPHAYRVLLDALAATGSDFSAGSFCRLHGRTRIPVRFADELHRDPRYGLTLAQEPAALHDVFLWNKVFRRRFWDRAVGALPEGVRYEDQVPTARAFLRAEAFDLLPAVVYRWRIREDGSSITQGKHLPEDLRDRLQAASAVAALIGREAGPDVLAAWRRRLYETDLPPYLEQAVDADGAYRELLRTGLAELASPALLAVTTAADPQSRMLADFARRGEWEALKQMVLGRINYGTATALQLTPAGIRGALPDPPAAAEPAEELRTAGPEQLRAEAGLLECRDLGPVAAVTGYAYLDGVDAGGLPVRLSAALPGPEVSTGRALEVERHADPDIDLLSRDRHVGHADAGFTVRVPRPLPAELVLTLHVGGHTARTRLPLPAEPLRPLGFRATDDILVLELPPGIEGSGLALTTAATALPAVVTARHPDGTVQRLRIRLTSTGWHGTGPAPAGTYTLRARPASPGRAAAAAGPGDPAVRLPVGTFPAARPQLTSSHRIRLFGTAGRLAVTLSAPLPAEDAGARAQQALRRTMAGRGRAGRLEPGILFESYGGTACNDSPRAMSDFLAADGFDEPLYWSVRDTSVQVPAYAVPLLRGSREWFERLSRTRRLVNNNNFPWFFRKDPGQVYLQTWHGTPLKRIGRDVPSRQVSLSYRDLMDREAQWWDLLLAQNAYAAQVLPRALGYGGAVLTAGLPRNDLLINDDGAVRSKVRRRLGIGPSQRVLLYAPTWRDDARDAGGRTGWVGHLDVPAATRRLGRQWTILVRGHHNIASRAAAADGAVDVSGWPEITELLLAADALVTDYSSALFDYAHLRRPMYFLAPDLQAFTAQRGFYLDPALLPGPVLGSSAELAAAMTSGERRGDRLHRFAATYATEDGRAAEAASRALLAAAPGGRPAAEPAGAGRG